MAAARVFRDRRVCVGISLLDRRAHHAAASAPDVFSFLTRVFGLLLAAIAVQLVVNGVKSLT